MTSAAIDIYDEQLAYQMGESGHFTEEATLDPYGAIEQTIYGIFDDNAIALNKDGGNINQKTQKPRFIVSSIDSNFDVYENKEIYLSKRDRYFIINNIQKDTQGLIVLWLRNKA